MITEVGEGMSLWRVWFTKTWKMPVLKSGGAWCVWFVKVIKDFCLVERKVAKRGQQILQYFIACKFLCFAPDPYIVLSFTTLPSSLPPPQQKPNRLFSLVLKLTRDLITKLLDYQFSLFLFLVFSLIIYCCY